MYLQRIPGDSVPVQNIGPLADRIDIHIEIFPVPYEELIDSAGRNIKKGNSEQMRNAVEIARSVQIDRYRRERISYNSQLTPPLIKILPFRQGVGTVIENGL